MILWRDARVAANRAGRIRAVTDGAVLVHEPSDVERVARQLGGAAPFLLFVAPRAWRAAWSAVASDAHRLLPPLVYDPPAARAAARLARAVGDSSSDDRGIRRCWLDLIHALAWFDGTSRPPSLGGWPALARIRSYLLAESDDRMSLDHLARATGLGKCYLVRALGMLTGLPPHQLRVRMRLWRARRLLEGGGRLAMVAAELGFAHQSHFTSWFRRVFGVTPAAGLGSFMDPHAHPTRPRPAQGAQNQR